MRTARLSTSSSASSWVEPLDRDPQPRVRVQRQLGLQPDQVLDGVEGRHGVAAKQQLALGVAPIQRPPASARPPFTVAILAGCAWCCQLSRVSVTLQPLRARRHSACKEQLAFADVPRQRGARSSSARASSKRPRLREQVARTLGSRW